MANAKAANSLTDTIDGVKTSEVTYSRIDGEKQIMSEVAPIRSTTSEAVGIISYYGFLRRALWLVTEGSLFYYAWMTLLTAIALVGAHAWAVQVADGMITTRMTDDVSWGLYIYKFTSF